MNNKLSKITTLAAGILLLTTGTAQAATDYLFGAAPGSTTSVTVGGITASQFNYTGVSITGWAATRNSVGDANAEFNLAPVVSYGTGGLGVTQSGETSPQHALDNEGTNEFFLLSFSTPVALTNLKIGYPDVASGLDTDFTVLAFTGANNLAGSPTTAANGGFALADMNLLNSDPTDVGPAAPAGGSYGLTNAGWEIIGNPDNVVANTNASIGNTSFKSSSFWLVGTRNKFLATADANFDYGKLLSVTGCTAGTPGCGGSTTGGVPEPSSLALLGLGLLGTAKRWRKKAA